MIALHRIEALPRSPVTSTEAPADSFSEFPSLSSASMSGEYIPVEQDKAAPPSGDALPTYDDLAAQNGPNSRSIIFPRDSRSKVFG